jgi:hypothetical protein
MKCPRISAFFVCMACLMLGTPARAADGNVVARLEGRVFHWIKLAADDTGRDVSQYQIEVTDKGDAVVVAFRLPLPPLSRMRGSPGGIANPNYLITINKSDGRVLEREMEK